MIEYQPKSPELFNLGIELLEQNEHIDGIQCFIDEPNLRMIAELTINEEPKLIGTRLLHSTGDKAKDLDILERDLCNEIKVYLLIENILDKVKQLNGKVF